MSYEKINKQGFIVLGDGKDGTVQQWEGYLVGFKERENKKSGHTLILQELRAPHALVTLFTSTVINRTVLNKDETDIIPALRNVQIKLVYTGMGKKKKGQNAAKLIDVFVDSKKKLAKNLSFLTR